MKRLTALVIMLVLAVSGGFALDGIVTWTWYENDPEVEYYRYQVDGEYDGLWTVVDWSVNEVSLELDVSVIHTLYLQQSYDGINWSESSMTDSEIFEEYEESVPEEEPYEQEEQPEEVPEEPVVAEVTETAPVREKVPLDVSLGYMNHVPDSSGPKALGVVGSITQKIVNLGTFDFCLKANLSLYSTKNIVFDIRHTQFYSFFNILALLSARVESCDIYAGIGPDIGFGLISRNSFNAGLAAEIGVRYHIKQNFAIGFALSDHYYLTPVSTSVNRMDMRAFASFAL